MPLVDAALAFALTMLIVATAVTQILRFLQNAANLRRVELQKMLKEYVNTQLTWELNRLKKRP